MLQFKCAGRALTAVVALLSVMSVVSAQQPGTRIRGQIEKADGNVLTLKTREGATLQVHVAEDARVSALEKASLKDIKNDTFIGIAGMPRPDGSIEAFSIHIFLPAQRGVIPDRHGPWDARQGSTMTNAYVESEVAGKEGDTLKVKYKDGEKTVHVSPQTAIAAAAKGDKSELKAGAQIIIFAWDKQPDGSILAKILYADAASRPRCDRGMRGLAFGLALVSASAVAQPFAPETMRISGIIERLEGDDVTIRAIEGGGTTTVQLIKNATVFDVARAALADIKPGSFIGAGAVPQDDGTQRALRVTVFAESLRGQSEGFRPWDRTPGGTMTNATVAEMVKSVDGQVITVKYKDGEKRIVIPPDVRILAYLPGTRSELKVGAAVAITRAKRKLDGSWEADRITVGRDGVMPD